MQFLRFALGILAGIIVSFAVTGIVAFSAAHAQTASERAACRPDVFRLCTVAQIAHAALGDRSGIYACFKAHRRELSPSCNRVLKRHGY